MDKCQQEIVPECSVCGAVYWHDPDCGDLARHRLDDALDKITHLERALQDKE